MNKEILLIAEQLKDSFGGEPWFGRSITALLRDVTEESALQQPAGQHSILELLWHMVTWREFVISRLQPDEKPLEYFEENDWRTLDHTDKMLWQAGLNKLHETQTLLLQLLSKQEDALLDATVPGRKYDYRKLLYGIVQHDIYHTGQIACITKFLRENK